MNDFPEAASIQLAKVLSKDLDVWVKSSLQIGDLNPEQLPGTRQLSAESILSLSQKVIRRFPEAGKKTHFILLTTRDINSESGGFRFQFSHHSKELKTSVVSMARLFEYENNKPVVTDLVLTRLYKMSKRAIGENYLGWKRASDINDVMYSPLMGVTDLDRIGINHAETQKKDDSNAERKVPGIAI
jgi:predicted Zn-dependent protease